MYDTAYSFASRLIDMPKGAEVGPGDKLSQLREKKNLSLRQAARLSEGGVSHAYIADLEKGIAPWSKASLTTVRGLARAYDLTVADLLHYINGADARALEFEDEALVVSFETEVIRTTRTVPAFNLTVSRSDQKGDLVPSDKRIYIDEDWQGDFEAVLLEVSGRYQATVIIRRQTYAAKGDEILFSSAEHGWLFADVKDVDGQTYFLDGLDFDAFVAKNPAIRGVVVRKQFDRLAN